MDLKKYVFSVIKKLTKKKFDENSHINEIDIDSLDIVEIVIASEKKFNITIADEELNNLKKIKDIIFLLNKKISKK